ncbi:hypothetical protein PAXINDRAFT_14322 [Paxillus involutus ATCC 200175]|uniref:Uncharacterized protein n=1 Tax=Paxillus involutus ATCC 200175 TaxID=664439 RepID=A0A0C9TR68_PAXIN|nr:hypothetical protein PAXINDRAFT_14322 [Paxillus involutus ATCC 200175]
MSLLAHFQLNQGLALSTSSNGQPAAEAQAGESQPEATTDRTQQVPERATSLSPPPESPRTQRRPRSPSADADLEDPVRVLKRRRQYAAGLCSKFNLPDNSLQDFAGQDLVTMLIHMQATLLKFESSREKEDALLFIESDEFKLIMKDRLRTCLLSPNLTGYLHDLPENVWAFAKKNLPVFKIPAKALEDPEMAEKIDTLIKDVLTKQRAQIKSKIIASVKAKSHISMLARTLSPSGVYEITTHHWARISFLRACLISFNELVSESMAAKVADQQKNKDPEGVPTNAVQQVSHTEESADPDAEDTDDKMTKKARYWKDTEFWEYVDCLLADISDETMEKDLDAAGRRKELDTFFTHCLQGDMKQFPGSKRNAPIPASTSVTVQWQKAIHEELVW